MTSPVADRLASVEQITEGLASVGYIASTQIATALYLGQHLTKPILVEGTAGVGKTELARSTAEMVGKPLIRLQCYEGLDEAKALYEWKYGKQLLYTQILKERLGAFLEDTKGIDDAVAKLHGFGDVFYSEGFLEPRPLLKALQQEAGAVLLIDEVDKSDDEFEAFLLEILSDFQASIPEIGTIKATVPPLVFLTSNNMREMGDALKRRCLHLYVPLPGQKLEERIVEVRVPGIADSLKRQLVSFVQQLREHDLNKLPSVSETVDWARALILLNVETLAPQTVRDTLNVLLKFEEDIAAVAGEIAPMTRTAVKSGESWSPGGD